MQGQVACCFMKVVCTTESSICTYSTSLHECSTKYRYRDVLYSHLEQCAAHALHDEGTVHFSNMHHAHVPSCDHLILFNDGILYLCSYTSFQDLGSSRYRFTTFFQLANIGKWELRVPRDRICRPTNESSVMINFNFKLALVQIHNYIKYQNMSCIMYAVYSLIIVLIA